MSIRRFGNRLDPDTLLRLYRFGLFPMADSAHDPNVFIVNPDRRGVLPLKGFHVPSRLRRTVRAEPYRVTLDTAFARVMQGCAAPRPGRESTWINSTILSLYCELHRRGHAHSVECWDREALVGGLYGVSIGGVFFGESMFSTAPDASKIALVHLVARMLAGGYTLLDTQFVNDHLTQFGVMEVERDDFMIMLSRALRGRGDIHAAGSDLTGQDALQLITQTS
jgi:leucyl/phenylalanyl-tRNA--protein transferase